MIEMGHPTVEQRVATAKALAARGWNHRFAVSRIPDCAVYLGPWGRAVRWWWGPFIFSQWPSGRIDGHVHHSGRCCGVKVAINAGEWGTPRRRS